MTKFRLRAASSALAIATAVAGGQGAVAQQLEEIVVTARKVEENLMQVPIAITAFSARDIDAMNLKQLTDIALMTPSFNFVNQSGGSGRNDRSGNTLVFRGLYLNNNAGTGAGGLLFIDGAPVIGASAPMPNDIERIEILKGPQSAYFGRSTFMGAINFVMREPSDEFRGRITGEYSSFKSSEGTLSLEGPLIEDKLLARVSLRSYDRGGQYTNAFNRTEKLGAQSTQAVSTSIVAKPSDALKIKLFANYFSDSDGTPAQGTLTDDFINCFPGNPPAGSRASRGFICGELPKVSAIPPIQISADSVLTPFLYDQVYTKRPAHWQIYDPNFNDHFGLERRAFQSDLRVDYDFANGYTFSSLTAYHRDKSSVVLDSTYRGEGDRPNPVYDPTNPDSFPLFTFMRQTQGLVSDWSQEVRIASPQDQRFRWMAGFNYLKVKSPGGPVSGYDIRGRAFASSITRTNNETPAVFGGAFFDITEDLTLTAEARYQWDKVSQTPVVAVNGLAIANPTALANTFKSFSPRVSVDYNFSDDGMVYALFSRGYRPGGFNAALATADAATLAALQAAAPSAGVTFEEEQLDNYEIGIKSDFMDGRARATLSAYYMKWKNGQAGASIPVRLEGPPVVTNLINLTINTGLATLKGYELEGQFQVTDELLITGSMGLNDSKVSTSQPALYRCTDCLNITGDAGGGLGNRLPTAPKWMWALSAAYTARLAGDYDWFARVDWSHRGKNYTDFTNLAWVGASDNVNARLGIRTDDLSIEAFVTNLTQNKVMAAGLAAFDVYTFAVPPLTNAIRYSLPLKRTFGIRAGYNF